MQILITSVNHETYSFHGSQGVEHIGLEGRTVVECVLLFTESQPAKATFSLKTEDVSSMTFKDIAKHIHGLIYEKDSNE